MIGSFWNLCRACPSMPVDKLHSEYRSTYRWHEFAARATQAAPTRAPSGVTSQPEARALEPAMPRRKKYPGVAYKTNELFDAAPPPRQPRSKSEGPGRARWTDTVEDKPRAAPALGDIELRPAGIVTGAGHQHQSSGATAAEPRKSASMGALRLAQQAADTGAADNVDGGAGDDRADGVGAECEPLVPSNHHPIRKSTFRSALSAFISNGEDRSKDNRKRYKTEYKKKFRPFSQYVYEASKGTFTKCRGLKGRSQGEGDVMDKSTDAKDAPDGKNTGEGSWYREVIDLRKRAGEYKCRGWGTELAPDHIAQLYSKQMELWSAVSRRSSLAALALAPPPRAPPPPSSNNNSRAKSPKKVPPRSPHKQARKPQHSLDEAHTAQPEGRGSPRRRPRSADPRPVPHHQPTPQPNQQPTQQPTPQPPTKPTEGADEEPLVKSPPEPTRVKSPEQLSIRSPEPVNWTVPLDTHTTFTVTQNVQPPPDDSSRRAASELRAHAPLPVPLSAPLLAPLPAPVDAR